MMSAKTYLVKMRQPHEGIQRVRADRFDIRDEHLGFLTVDGSTAAVFLADLIESFELAGRSADGQAT